MSDWCTIESDPAVFTELIEKIGVKGIGVEEVYSLEDAELIEQLGKIYGFIFLFKWQKETVARPVLDQYPEEMFFAHQVITNACATQALLSILLNVPELEIGEELSNFKSFSMSLDANTRGMVIGELETVKKVHNSFAKPEPFIYGGKKSSKGTEDVFHFISYIPFQGKVYELDGLQQGPILHGESNDNWIDAARLAINQRIANYASNEIRFTLLALTENRASKSAREITELKSEKGRLYGILKSLQGSEFDDSIYEDFQECVRKLIFGLIFRVRFSEEWRLKATHPTSRMLML